MMLSGIHAAQNERELRGYQWFWSLQAPMHPQPIPGSIATTIITRQEVPWHPVSLLGNAVIEPSSVITFRDFSFHPPYSAIVMRLAGHQGATIATGIKGYLPIRFDCNIARVMLVSSAVGSVVIDIYKRTVNDAVAGNLPGTNDTIIPESAFRPTLNNAQSSADATLYFWNTALKTGDLLAFDVVSATGINNLTMTLFVARKTMP